VLQLLNEALHRDNAERFCTAAFAFAETGPRPRLALSSGGHPSPLLRRSSRVAPLEAPGALLGPFSGWEGETLSVALQPGDLVLFYSDGVTEARRGREQFGVDRLVAALQAAPDESAAATIDSVVGALISFSPTASDDIAVIALRVTGETPAAEAETV
jgi:sigma-B regulation protein RsbU (phosphoserine phosphatase)